MKPLLLTLGEPAGIGPDCVLRAFAEAPEAFTDIVIAAPAEWLAARAAEADLDVPLHECVGLDDLEAGALNCWNPLPEHTPVAPVHAGRPSQDTAMAVVGCIEAAAIACLKGNAAALVTGPIEKAVLRDAGFAFPGHTEYLAHLAGDVPFVMMLASDQLRVALLTTHLALRDVPASLSVAQTLATLRIVHADLKKRFGIARPRIGLCALNPHAGEAGHFGHEEIDILAPAAKAARGDGIDVHGPMPSDTLFAPPIREHFDAIVCCYHDQGLIPIKALSFGESVNVTLGLPFIRTSVDHGTALDRAGKNDVSYSSLLAAIRMARQIVRGAVTNVAGSR
ncbi:MAG TPA: 4-hydroxythreonine-4-phosphate dehydrogenase PdxA [Mariprofundaceae bacterium]|nr:4-hydroxythreonine-4-phosphate dehydrogenase PdxA [Mariprofundaceae bacterium]